MARGGIILNSDEKWMKKVFKLARRGRQDQPNPQVRPWLSGRGAGGKRLSPGCRRPHAEVVALGGQGRARALPFT